MAPSKKRPSIFRIVHPSFFPYLNYRLKTINIFVKMVMLCKFWVVDCGVAPGEQMYPQVVDKLPEDWSADDVQRKQDQPAIKKTGTAPETGKSDPI
jgi:hypothetical protein